MPQGYPFGSVAPYGLLDDGTPGLCISTLAEHTRNLGADGRASLFVDEAFPLGDPWTTVDSPCSAAPAATAARAVRLDRHGIDLDTRP